MAVSIALIRVELVEIHLARTGDKLSPMGTKSYSLRRYNDIDMRSTFAVMKAVARRI